MLEIMIFLLIEKLKIKKVNFYKKVPVILCTFMETFIYCFPIKKAGKLIYRIEI